jgi:hypothetical protein
VKQIHLSHWLADDQSKQSGPTDQPPGKPINSEAFQSDRQIVSRHESDSTVRAKVLAENQLFVPVAARLGKMAVLLPGIFR